MEEVKQNKSFLREEVFRRLFGIVLFVTQVIFLFCYVMGLFECLGTVVTPVTAVEMVISIIKITGATVYSSLVRFAVGGLYIALFIFLIKNLVASFGSFFSITFNNDFDIDKNSKLLDNLFNNSKSSFFCVILFVVLAGMFTSFEANVYLILCLTVGGVSHVFTRFLIFEINQNDHVQSILKTICAFLLCSAVIMIGIHVVMPSVNDIISGFVLVGLKIFGEAEPMQIVTSIWYNLASPVLYMVLQIMFLVMIDETLSYVNYVKSDKMKSLMKKVLGVVIALVICECVMGGVSVSLATGNNFATYFNMIKGILPLLFASIAGIITFTFPRDFILAEVRKTDKIKKDKKTHTVSIFEEGPPPEKEEKQVEVFVEKGAEDSPKD